MGDDVLVCFSACASSSLIVSNNLVTRDNTSADCPSGPVLRINPVLPEQHCPKTRVMSE